MEQKILTENPTHEYKINYVQTYLWPPGIVTPKPWSSIDKGLRDQVDGILVLKLPFKAADVELFPNLKVYGLSLPVTCKILNKPQASSAWVWATIVLTE
jgi:hypothetical protein